MKVDRYAYFEFRKYIEKHLYGMTGAGASTTPRGLAARTAREMGGVSAGLAQLHGNI